MKPFANGSTPQFSERTQRHPRRCNKIGLWVNERNVHGLGGQYTELEYFWIIMVLECQRCQRCLASHAVPKLVAYPAVPTIYLHFKIKLLSFENLCFLLLSISDRNPITTYMTPRNWDLNLLCIWNTQDCYSRSLLNSCIEKSLWFLSTHEVILLMFMIWRKTLLSSQIIKGQFLWRIQNYQTFIFLNVFPKYIKSHKNSAFGIVFQKYDSQTSICIYPNL